MKRKKRLEKGIKSIDKQIEIHEEKLKEAMEKGDEELVDYYKSELFTFEKEKQKKKEKLDRKS